MKTIAERVIRPITKTILLGILLSLLFSAVFFSPHFVAVIVVFFMCCAILAVRVYFILQANHDETPPIYVEGENIYCYNGKVILEFPVWDLYYAKGKNKKYFHVFGNFVSWGTYHYGKIKVCYDDDGKKETFVIKNVLEPENAAIRLMQYVEDFERSENFTDYYQILRVRTDATQQEIIDAYNKLKQQKPDDIELITVAFHTLSSPKQRAEYDVEYWSVHYG
ncbi:MAG: DnaJ domain-containing protein [Clostridia bacterium]|nr:DnaJ domain-containing protein [Clostridia bacterium]